MVFLEVTGGDKYHIVTIKFPLDLSLFLFLFYLIFI